MSLLAVLMYRDLVQFAEPVDELDDDLDEAFSEWQDEGEAGA